VILEISGYQSHIDRHVLLYRDIFQDWYLRPAFSASGRVVCRIILCHITSSYDDVVDGVSRDLDDCLARGYLTWLVQLERARIA